VLEKAARVQTKDFIRIADEAAGKQSHPLLIKNLIEYAITNYK